MVDVTAINYWAILGAAAANMVLGFLWYGPLFGKKWMELSGMTMDKMKSMKTTPAQGYVMAFIGALVMAYILVFFIGSANAITLQQRLMTGFWIWLGFFATKSLGSVTWEGKPLSLYFLNNAYDLLSILAMAAILTF